MKQVAKKEIVTLISESKPALENALAIPEMAQRLANFGYDQAKLEAGLTMCQALEAEYHGQRENYKQKNNSSQSVKVAREAATETYIRLRRRAKVALEEYPEKRELLGLNEAQAAGYKKLRDQAIYFYDHALADKEALTTLATYQISQADLEAGLALFKTADQSEKMRLASKGTAQQSTQDRNAAAIEFEGWMRNFWKIAEVATTDKPQLLEQLGRVVS